MHWKILRGEVFIMLQYLFSHDFGEVMKILFMYGFAYTIITLVPNLILIIGFSKVVKAIKGLKKF